MNVVDSSGWIEYAVDGARASAFEGPLTDPDELIVPSISIFEVYRYILRERGRQWALEVTASMRQAHVVELGAGLAVEAAELASVRGLPLADAIIYATALAHSATLWTLDRDFEGLENVRFIGK